MLKRILIKLLLMFFSAELKKDVRGLIYKYNQFEDVNGERKRSQVYNALVTLYPDLLPRDLALLIELACQED